MGGGASGTLVAINLARSAKGKLSVTIAEPNELIGRGIAYGTQDSAHLLNVPAGRMSAFVEEPDHYCNWAGLQQALMQGFPFMRNFLAGTLAYSALFFGGFELLKMRFPQLSVTE